MEEKRLLTVGDVARRFGLSSAAIVAMERAGKLRAIRTQGGMRLFELDEVEKAAHQRAARSGRSVIVSESEQ